MTRRINAPDDVLLPVREVEVQLPVERDPEGGQHEGGEVAGAGGHLLVAEVGQAARGAAVDVQRLPHRELGHPQQRVPHVVQHLAVDFTLILSEIRYCVFPLLRQVRYCSKILIATLLTR